MAREIIDKYRRRIATAALQRMQRKTGGNLLIVSLPDGELTTIEITEHFMTQLLLRFEGLTRVEFGRTDGETAILAAYRNAININQHTEYLTESGKLIVDNLLKEVVDYEKEKYTSGGIN
ncbi:TPA: hypothetical protein JTP90_004188 [Escherichia coli]|uniref:hypothetical protein n=1 Tax=Escherichia coli TaxID=562 RepID=UPI000EF7B2CF|nr:hypothetical protein [Escherichia coli]AYW30945.1 hypothetical protein CQP61_16620 [Escherichia coli]EIY9045730.1 hypothetical protein [Escherichia coli]EJB8795055.1 hypothetical protein [Escherichia coli]EKG5177976.1 hypothetical protein [Escherichia coli]RLY43946.1 hypothetical protein EAI36_15000 [Escherichia coli]